jgi:16S rRNA (uracil1498-N3)-methyltransferase
MKPPFFHADPSTIRDGEVTLSRTESHHAARVLRLGKGDLVVVVDGLGNAYRGGINRVSRRGEVEVTIHSHIRNLGEPSVVVTLASGLSGGQKFDTVIEKATELGVKRLVPLITDKSRVIIDNPARARARVRRFEKVALAAMKQSRRSYRPEISSPTIFEDYLKEIDAASLSLLFHPGSQASRLTDITFPSDLKRVNVIIGPEAGFSADELGQATTKGVKVVTLGPRILRTETAGPVVCALVMNQLGELR